MTVPVPPAVSVATGSTALPQVCLEGETAVPVGVMEHRGEAGALGVVLAEPSWRLAMVTAGTLTACVGGDARQLPVGGAVLLPPMTTWQALAGETDWVAVSAWLHRLPPECPQPGGVTWLEQGQELLPWVQRLEEWSRQPELAPMAELVTLASFCLQLFLRLARRSDDLGERDGLKRVLEHMHAHVAEVLPIPKLAAIAGMSEGHFRRQFRQRTGLGPLEYIRRLRVSQAVNLLQQTRLTLREIANATGFTDERYLARVVGECTGHTPTTWRELAR